MCGIHGKYKQCIQKLYWKTILNETAWGALDVGGANVKMCIREISCKNIYVV